MTKNIAHANEPPKAPKKGVKMLLYIKDVNPIMEQTVDSMAACTYK